MMPSSVLLALVLSLAGGLSGCERAMQDMYDQPRYKPLRPAHDLPGGGSSQPLPAGSVVHSEGNLAGVSSGTAGKGGVTEAARAEAAQSMPYPVTSAFVHRGQDRYAIYCAPCHSPVGDGDGLISRRGFPRPPSYHTTRLREASDRHLYDVIAGGYGIMYSYADRISPSDRWAIVAYIRALQLSQHADVSQLPSDERAHLSSVQDERR